MSKYIRLEEGVFQVGEKVIVKTNNDKNVTSFPNESGYYITRKNKYGGIDIRYAGESEIIKEANNLEELCDKFVSIDKDNYARVEGTRYMEALKRMVNTGYTIYAAVWTYEGLKYVAKMNKYGDLELI